MEFIYIHFYFIFSSVYFNAEKTSKKARDDPNDALRHIISFA